MHEQPDVLVTGGNIQSNWCRQTAAAAARLEIPIVLVLRNSDRQEIQGNALLDYLLGADVRFVDEPDMTALVRERIDEVVAEICAEGRKAVKVDSWSDSVALGHVQLISELHAQCEELDVAPTRLWFAAAGPTQSGALLGTRMLHWPLHVTGVAPIEWTDSPMEKLTSDCANNAARLLGTDIRIAAAEVESLSQYIGPGYGIPSPAGLEAMRRLAQSDGLLLDPVYTGKAMAGLIDHIETGRIGPAETVIFVHTGGLPALFAYQSRARRIPGRLHRRRPSAMTAARSEDSNPRSSDATVVRPLGRSPNLAVSPVSGDLCPSPLGSVLRFGPSNRLSLANHPGARRRTQCDEHTPNL